MIDQMHYNIDILRIKKSFDYSNKTIKKIERCR